MRWIFIVLLAMALPDEAQARRTFDATGPVSYTHLTLPTNREV